MIKFFNKKIIVLIAVSIFVLAGLTGILSSSSNEAAISGNATPAAATSNTTFTTGWFGTFNANWNPFLWVTVYGQWIEHYLYLPLVFFNPTNQSIAPGIASTWDVNYTNHTAIFHLNPNAVWSDGQPVTAQDVVYTYNTWAQSWVYHEEYVSSVTNVTAINNSTVMISFTGVLWLQFAAYVSVVPYHIYKNLNPQNYSGYNANSTPMVVDDGPYVLSKFVQGQYTEIQLNQKWWGTPKPKITNVIFQEFSSQSSAVSALESGAVQGLANIPPADVSLFSNSSQYVTKAYAGDEYFYLAMNVQTTGTGNPTLHNLTVRQAIAHAINTTYLAQVVYHGYATPLNSPITPSNLFYDKNLTAYSYNISLANQMLNSSGFKLVNGVRESANGTKLKYNLLVPSADAQAVQMADLIAQNLTSIGISVTVQAETTGAMVSTIWAGNNTLGQDMDLWDWFDNLPSTPYLLSTFLSSKVASEVSDSGFNNTTYDQLWNSIANASSLSQAKSIADQLQVMLYDQIPYINLAVPDAINVWDASYTNITENVLGGPFGGVDWQAFLFMQPPTSTSHSPNYTMYYVIGGVIAVVVVAAAVVVAMRSRKN